MMSINKYILNKFKEKIIAYSYNDILFKPKDALVIIDDIERFEPIIIGLDFWGNKKNDYIEVNSTDWSNINNREDASKKTIKAARELLNGGLLKEEEFVSFVLEDQEIKE